MAEFIEPSELTELFLNGATLLDVRAESEFERSAVPGAFNIPLLRDAERAAVGTTYKRAGQHAAIALGHDLVHSGERSLRVDEWIRGVETYRPVALYCARGGLRSEISQRWIEESGLSLPRVRGGYKTIRNYLLQELKRICDSAEFILINGKTGSGKTRLLSELSLSHPVVDLEGCANHRGSTFGNVYGGQPTPGNFENALILALLRADAKGGRIILEAESRKIGWCTLPLILWEKMEQSPVALLEVSLEERVSLLLEDYVLFLIQRFQNDGLGRASERVGEFLKEATLKNEKRLGSERTARLIMLIDEATKEHVNTGSLEKHREWIELLLSEYYDGFYQRHIERSTSKVILRGSAAELKELL